MAFHVATLQRIWIMEIFNFLFELQWFSTLQSSNEYESWQFLISSSNRWFFKNFPRYKLPKNMNHGNFQFLLRIAMVFHIATLWRIWTMAIFNFFFEFLFSTLQPSNEYVSWKFSISSSNCNSFPRCNPPTNTNYGNF